MERSQKFEQKRAALVSALSYYVLENGLGQASLRDLAEAADTSDRMLLYYFQNRDDLVGTILGHIALEMQADLDTALPEGTDQVPLTTLAPQLTELVRSPPFKPYMIFWLEAAAAAARGIEPHATMSGALMDGFVAWAKARLTPEDQEKAYFILTLIDGVTFMEAAGRGAEAGAAVVDWAAS
ncbi:MAG: TetR/AcrR family transcriptional regulator [Alphaproteobacteria bacterium]